MIESQVFEGYEYESFMRFGKGGIAGVFLVRLQKIQDTEDDQPPEYKGLYCMKLIPEIYFTEYPDKEAKRRLNLKSEKKCLKMADP